MFNIPNNEEKETSLSTHNDVTEIITNPSKW